MKIDNVELWETRELGASEDHVQAVDLKLEIDDALELQAISIRLQKNLLKNLKLIASHYNVGYQPMIRDLLNRFAEAEAKKIIREQIRELKDQKKSSETTTSAVDEFMSDMKRRA